jgi:tetratricopeptide (TPR) repeat protein
MAGKHKSTTIAVSVLFMVTVLLGFVAFHFGGCAESEQSGGKSQVAKPAGVQKSEAGLLAELNQKFENPDVHYQLGALYHASKDWSKAEYHYNIALGFDPVHRASQAAIVKLQIERGNGPRAEQYARNYIAQASGSVKELLKLGQEFTNQKLNNYAFDCFKQAMSMAPNSADANKCMGFYYYNAGDKARAKEYLTRSFELNPNQPHVAGILGRLGVVVQVPTSTSSAGTGSPKAPGPQKPSPSKTGPEKQKK